VRICVLPQSQDAPGCYRCLFPAAALRARGHEAAQPKMLGHTADDLFRLTGMERGADIVFRLQADADTVLRRIGAQIYVFHRQLEANVPALQRMVQRELDAAVIVDSDDDDLGIPGYNPAFAGTHPRGNPQFNRANFLAGLRGADALTVTTPFLAERLSRYNDEVHVLPNYLEWSMWEDAEQQSEVERSRLRIGWMGRSFWHQGDLRVLAGLVGPWLERHPEVDFVAAGDEDVHDLLGVPLGQRVTLSPVHFRDGDLATITATMDVGLVPLETNGFNEAKSALKGMEYAACGIPCIATPTEAYRGWVEPGVNGFLAQRPKDWIRALDALVSDDGARRAMGRAARAKAARHTIAEHVGQWEALYARFGRESDLADAAIQRGAIQKHGELKPLLELLAGRELNTVCEIGTAAGGTFHALCQSAADDALIVSLDLPGGAFGGGYDQSQVPKLRSYAKPGQSLRFLLADSHDPRTLAELERILDGRTLDLLLIDGDHTYEGVKADFEMYTPLCSGIVAFHDILPHPHVLDCQVDRFWNEISGAYRSDEFVVPGDWGGLGVLFMDEARKAVAA
jgi:glycosyltransferase involved in cell wall biosynthesis